jgi:hypothetical protein
MLKHFEHRRSRLARKEVAVMRRLGMIVALGTLLGMLGGVMTASAAPAGRGTDGRSSPRRRPSLPASFCGFEVGVGFPTDNEFIKLLKASDGSR